jgi:hypothetical protein
MQPPEKYYMYKPSSGRLTESSGQNWRGSPSGGPLSAWWEQGSVGIETASTRPHQPHTLGGAWMHTLWVLYVRMDNCECSMRVCVRASLLLAASLSPSPHLSPLSLRDPISGAVWHLVSVGCFCRN